MLTRPSWLALTATIVALSAATAAAGAPAGPSIVFSRASARLSRRPFTRTYFWSGLAISGTVYDNGAPTAGQTVTATSTTGPGAGLTPVAQAVTNVTGRFTLELGRGGSREVQITTGAAAPVTFWERVRASMSLHIKTELGYRIVFSGQILTSWKRGEGLPWAIVQDQTPVGWSTIGAEPVGRYGHWTYTYQAVPADAGATFAFRAITRNGPGWLAASTATHWATVR
ncbi:MAG: hypothetical protein ACLP8S_32300 [Solirubrobacteraceae bacterium]